MATIGEVLVTLQDELRSALGSAASVSAPWALIERLASAGGTISGFLVEDSVSDGRAHRADAIFGAMQHAKKALAAYCAWTDTSALCWS